MSNPDRHARIEKECEWCGNLFMSRIERVNKGKGRFCSLVCANAKQKYETARKVYGIENGKKYWNKTRWIVRWYDEDGNSHTTSYPNWWWTINIGEIPDGYVIILKDKNTNNINPDNFACVMKGAVSRENGKNSKGMIGWEWSDEHKLEMSNKTKKNWENGVYEQVHVGENSPNWKGGKSKEEYPREFYQVREFVLSRDNYRCRICGKNLDNPKFAHVHHRDANKQHNEPENLISLCVHCHGQVHSTKPTSDVIMALRSELYQSLLGE